MNENDVADLRIFDDELTYANIELNTAVNASGLLKLARSPDTDDRPIADWNTAVEESSNAGRGKYIIYCAFDGCVSGITDKGYLEYSSNTENAKVFTTDEIKNISPSSEIYENLDKHVIRCTFYGYVSDIADDESLLYNPNKASAKVFTTDEIKNISPRLEFDHPHGSIPIILEF